MAIGVCYVGPLAEGEQLIAPVRRFGLPLEDQIRPMAYTALQSLMDTAYPPGNQYYQKDHYLLEISDEAIDIMVEHFACVSSPLSIPFLQQSGGAMQRGDTAYAHRAALYNLVLTAQWLDRGSRNATWAGSGIYGRPCGPIPRVGSSSTTSDTTTVQTKSGRPTAPIISVWRS